MADNVIGRLVYLITGDNSKLDGSIDKSKKKVDSFSKQLKDKSKQLSSIGNKLTLGLTTPIVGIGLASLKTAANIESQTKALEVMLKSGDKASALYQEWQQFSASTPFQLDEITQAGKSLIAFGENAEDVTETLRRIGDVAAGIGAPLGDVAEIYGKARVQQQLFAEDLNQLAGRGIPIFDELAKVLGVNSSEIKKLASEGKVGFEALEQVFINLTSAGGQFDGMMEEMSKTTEGKLSTAIDNLKMAGADLVESLLPLINDILDQVTEWARAFSELDDGTKHLILTMGGLAAAAGPVIKAFSLIAAHPAIAVIAALGVGVAHAARSMQNAATETGQFVEMLNLMGRGAKKRGEDVSAFAVEMADKLGISREQAAEIAEQEGFIVDQLKDQVKEQIELKNWQEEKAKLLQDYVTTQDNILDKTLDQLELEYESLKINAEKLRGTSLYEEAIVELNRIEAAITQKRIDRSNSEAAAEKKRLDQVITERNKATDEYSKRLQQLDEQRKTGYLDEEEYLNKLIQLNRNYYESLSDIGYTGLTSSLGDQAMQAALTNIQNLETALEELNNSGEETESFFQNLKTAVTDALPSVSSAANEIGRLKEGAENTAETINDALVSAFSDMSNAIGLAAAEVGEFGDENKRMSAEVESLIKALASTYVNEVNNIASSMGTALVEQGDAWLELGRTAVHAIAAIIEALGQQAAVQAVASFASLDIAGGFAWSAASALAFLTAGIVRALGDTITAAAAGADFVTDGPQLLLVGDNPGGRERVTVEPTSSPNMRGPGGITIINQHYLDGRIIHESVEEAIENGVIKIKNRLRMSR